MSTRRGSVVLVGAVLLAALAFVVSLMVGSVQLEPSQVLAAITGGGDDLSQRIVLELRLPRAASAFAVGGLLALAGSLMQVLLRNPLADPYILGVSGGAAVGALIAIMAGAGLLLVDVAAAVGATLSTFLVFGLAHGRGDWSSTRLLLTGVVVAAGWGAVTSLLLVMGEDGSMRSMLFWMMGDLSWARRPGPALGLLVAGMLLAVPLARHLDLFARGELLAGSLGVRVMPLQVTLYTVSAVLTAAAVTAAGSIGFVGLVVPHLLRQVQGAGHRWLLPSAVFAGGALLLIADLLARTLMAPVQLPVGVFTAAIGVPLFLYLLTRHRATA